MIGKAKISAEVFAFFLLRLAVDAFQAVGHKVLEYASQSHKRCEGEPEGVVANHRAERIEQREIGDGGKKH